MGNSLNTNFVTLKNPIKKVVIFLLRDVQSYIQHNCCCCCKSSCYL